MNIKKTKKVMMLIAAAACLGISGCGQQRVHELNEDSALIELKPGKVYEITANWDESELEFNGFFGEAGYVVLTE